MRRRRNKSRLAAEWIVSIGAVLFALFIIYTIVPSVHSSIRGLFSRENTFDNVALPQGGGQDDSKEMPAGKDDPVEEDVKVVSEDGQEDYVFWDPSIKTIAENAADVEAFYMAVPESTSYHDRMVGSDMIYDRNWSEGLQKRRARNKAFQRMMEEAKNAENASCVVQGIQYILKCAYTIEDLREVGISLEDTRLAGTEFDYDMSAYTFFAAELSIQNISGRTKKDVSCNPFRYLFLTEDIVGYQAEPLYGSCQPGKGTHKYFAAEMADGEMLETTIVFILPTDSEFDLDLYQSFIMVSTIDMSGAENLGYTGLIPVMKPNG